MSACVAAIAGAAKRVSGHSSARENSLDYAGRAVAVSEGALAGSLSAVAKRIMIDAVNERL